MEGTVSKTDAHIPSVCVVSAETNRQNGKNQFGQNNGDSCEICHNMRWMCLVQCIYHFIFCVLFCFLLLLLVRGAFRALAGVAVCIFCCVCVCNMTWIKWHRILCFCHLPLHGINVFECACRWNAHLFHS